MFQNVSLYCLLFFLGMLGLASGQVPAEKDLLTAFDHFETVAKNPDAFPGESHIETLLAYLDGAEQNKTVWEDERNVWGTGLGTTFRIDTSLPRMMGYLYNPDIPVEAVVPGVVRLIRNINYAGDKAGYRQLLTDKAGMDTPLMVRSTYRLAITPDHNSGAYYSYDQKELSRLSIWKGGATCSRSLCSQRPRMWGVKGIR